MADSVIAAAPIVDASAELRAGRRQAIGAAVIGNILE
jgi:hypothetical protein